MAKSQIWYRWNIQKLVFLLNKMGQNGHFDPQIALNDLCRNAACFLSACMTTHAIGESRAIMEATQVSKRYPTKHNVLGQAAGWFDALKPTNLAIMSGESVGLVGESGSGKSTLGKVLLGMETPDDGHVLWKGKPAEGRDFKRSAQPVFQDPFSALNPAMTVGAALEEAVGQRLAAEGETVDQLLIEVGLSPDDAARHPSSFSGGQRQRIVLARALALNPEFLVLDESVAALDLRIQAEILDLLMSLKAKRNLTFLFISHDLNVVASVCERILVMQHGQIVEEGPTDQIMSSPQHPYTQRLLNSRPGQKREGRVA